MYTITVRTEFNSAHRLRNYRGKCEGLHGHNWTAEVTVGAKQLDKTGMVVDFTLLKKELNKFLERLDHKFLNEIRPFNKINPTSENIARYIYDGMKRFKPINVTVWETPTSGATYAE